MNTLGARTRIHVAGHTGMVGSAIVRRLMEKGLDDLVLRTRNELDLTNQQAVERFYNEERPDVVFLAAAKVGGILANSTFPADFIRDNLAIQTNVIYSAWRNGAKKLLFLGSSCIYPKFAPQPLHESALLTGPLEPTNEWYALAKIAGLKMCQAYRRQYGFDAVSAMPTNLYGPGDNYDDRNSHVIPALIRRIVSAKRNSAPDVLIWGSGTPLREFMHVDDLADALIFLMDNYDGEEPINVGSGQEISIAGLATMIADIIGYEGCLRFDTGRPDGTPRKLLDTSKLQALGWRAQTPLREGLAATIAGLAWESPPLRGT
jgi:GDP-L-fucose synthase